MRNNDLFERLSALGFPLFEAEKLEDANLTLADVVKEKNLRLWEGFPVVLLNCVQKDLFSFDKVERYFKKASDKHNFMSLLVMSLALYKALKLKFSWTDNYYKFFTESDKKQFYNFVQKLKNNVDFEMDGQLMSSSRLKAVFNMYFRQREQNVNKFLAVEKEFSVEFALSQFFSPKQKELFLKKLKGDKLTKTEREYFSRTVKKKVLALANPELCQLAQRLLK